MKKNLIRGILTALWVFLIAYLVTLCITLCVYQYRRHDIVEETVPQERLEEVTP